MDPVGVVYQIENDDYLYVSKFSEGFIWIGQGNSPAQAVAELDICLGRRDAKILASILNEEAHAD